MKSFYLHPKQTAIRPMQLGGNVFGWTLNESQSFAILNQFENCGYQFIDTADSYSRWAPNNVGGESERIIGKWMRERNNRMNMVIATKVGSDMGQGVCLKANYIIKSCEDSLRRLQTDYIDLYYTHFDDTSTPVEETLKAYDKLYREGKICTLGASNISPERLKESLAFSANNGLIGYTALQPHYNLLERTYFEKELLPIVQSYNLKVFPYYALASGFLTGKYKDQTDLTQSPRGAAVARYYTPENFALLAEMERIAAAHQAQTSSIALAWLLHQQGVTAPIASATTLSQLNSLLLSTELVLSQNEMERLNQLSTPPI